MIPLLTGCVAHNLSKAYKPQSAVVNTPKADMLFVEYPTENRPLKGKSKVWNGMLILIPLLPYADYVMAPEYAMRAQYKFGYSFTTDLHITIAHDIKASGIVKEVIAEGKRLKKVDLEFDPNIIVRPASTWEGSTTNDLPKGCRRLSLRLDEGVMDCAGTAYGLSIAATPLWILGAPLVYGDFDLKLTATLKTREGRVIAERSFAYQHDYWQVIYNNRAGLQAMPKAYAGISADLRTFLKENL